LGLFPARIKEISNPRLKAWLNIRRVWNVDTNGNHEKNAMGTKMSIPMPASYRRASDRMNFHSPSLFITGFHAAAIYTKDNQHLRIRVMQMHTVEILKPLMPNQLPFSTLNSVPLTKKCLDKCVGFQMSNNKII